MVSHHFGILDSGMFANFSMILLFLKCLCEEITTDQVPEAAIIKQNQARLEAEFFKPEFGERVAAVKGRWTATLVDILESAR